MGDPENENDEGQRNSIFDKVKSVNTIHINDIQKAQKIAIKEILNTPLVKLHHDVPGKE